MKAAIAEKVTNDDPTFAVRRKHLDAIDTPFARNRLRLWVKIAR
jgi:hypothetical protein